MKIVFKTLRNKIFVTASIVIFSAMLVFGTITMILIYDRLVSENKNKIQFISDNLVENIVNEIKQNLSIPQTLATSMASVSDPVHPTKLERNQTAKLLYEIIYNNQDITDIYTLWEPELFDHRDEFFKERTDHDTSGRFMVLWKKEKGYINRDIVQNYDDIKLGKFYSIPKKYLSSVALNPQIERVNGINLVKLPLISPIIYESKFLGIVGINVNSEWIQDLSQKHSESHSDIQMIVVANDGNVIAHSSKKHYIGRNISDFVENSDKLFLNIKRGYPVFEERNNEIIFGKPFSIDKSDTPFQLLLIFPKSYYYENANHTLYLMIAALILILAISTFILRIFTKNSFRYLRAIDQYTRHLSMGNLMQTTLNWEKHQELGSISSHLIKINDRMKEIVQLSETVSKGEFSDVFKTQNQNDNLGFALNKMIDTLKISKEKEIEQKILEEKLSWRRQGIAKLSEAIRQSSTDLNQLSASIVHSLVIYMDAALGGMFLFNNENEDDLHLSLVAAFAYNTQKIIKKKVLLGEGLVGTCAVEQQNIYISKLPSEYIDISSGLGSSVPESMIIFPIKTENNFIGVIELAFLRKLNEHEIKFIDLVAETIASAIASAKINSKTLELLEQSRKQAEILQLKELESRQNIEKLESVQKETIKREAELKGILNAVNNTILTIEYTTEGILLNANDKYLNTMHYTMDQIKGVNVLELVKDERDELKRIMDSVAKGNFHQKVVKRFTKEGEVRWLLSTYTPFYDFDGNITKILYFAFDITESKEHTEKLAARVSELEHQLEMFNSGMIDNNNKS